MVRMSQQKKNSKNETQIQWQLPAESLEEITRNIAVIISKLGPKFMFGPYELEDLESEALLWINKKYPKYDGKRSLFNFMYTVIKNELYNLKRNKFSRLSPPCAKCPLNAFVDGKCVAYENMEDCSYYAKWIKINKSKEQLMTVYSAEDSPDKASPSPLQKLLCNEELQRIWDKLPEKHRKTMEDVLTNEKVNKVRLNNLIKECKWVIDNVEDSSEADE